MLMIVSQILALIVIISVIVGIIKGLLNRFVGAVITLIMIYLCYVVWAYHVTTVDQFIDAIQDTLPTLPKNIENILSAIWDYATMVIQKVRDALFPSKG